MRTIRLLTLALLTALVSACATHAPLDSGTRSSLRGKSLAVVHHNSPSFVAMTSGKGMFAVAGVAAAAAAGNELVREHRIADPAPEIGRSLSRELGKRFGLRTTPQVLQAESTAVTDLAALASEHDFVLDVSTHGWGYQYDGFKFGDYFVGYSAKLRLIDVRTQKVVAKGLCLYDAKKAGKVGVAHDRLLADGAAVIKHELNDASGFCVEDLQSKVF